MLNVTEAQKIILETAQPLRPLERKLSEVVGLVLAEDVVSDLDMPPYDKALMDGYAVRGADLAGGEATLTVIEEVVAGRVPTKEVGAGQATRIMTGAPMPRGADAVVIVERSEPVDATRVRLKDRPRPAQNILDRGREMRAGETVLRTGAKIGPQECGLLAAVGRATVQVFPRPSVAILPTGDEIVEPHQKPGPGQIRNSNGLTLFAQTLRAGAMPRLLGIGRDHVESLRGFITEGLGADVLVLSGGVSAGKLDLVPEVLAGLGVDIRFQKVAMKPGKPMLFGVRKNASATTLVFGLPGNPVSTLVCFELFVRPALRKLAGEVEPGPVWVEAELESDFPYRSDRPTYHPARVAAEGNRLRFAIVPWFGSADLRGLLAANAFALLPAGEHQHRAGQMFPVLKVDPV